MHQSLGVRAGRRTGAILSIGALALLLACQEVAAADGAAAARHPVEQPAQALGDALRAIARQTGVSVLFDPAAVSGRTSQPVSGRLTAAEAIARALEGSGLSAAVMPDGAVVVRPSAAGSPQPSSQGPRPPLQVADAAGAAGVGTVAGEATSLKRVEVTGSRLARVEGEGPTPVNVYSGEDIERSGQTSLGRFLASLNEVSASAGEGSAASTLGQGTVQLRGLPLGSTLVLVNGRRVQAVGSSGANFFNLNLIPLAAIERVEIVPVGSSAVYGGDALAGVVNVILKKHIDGQAFTARLGGGHGTRDGGLSLATGGEDENGSYLLLGSYSKTTPLTMAEREFFRDADYRRFGGSDTRVRNCTPGTVSSVSGASLPGLSSSFAGIPQGVTGRPQVSDFEATAGVANLCNLRANGNGLTLVHGTETLGLHAAAERRIKAGWTGFGELTLAHERLEARDIGLTLTSVLVPASNPYNPFGEDVRVTGVLGPDNGLQGFQRRTRFTRALVGLRGELPAGWEAELTASTTRDRGDSRSFNANLDPVARAAALASSSPSSAINPFTAGRAATDEVLGSIWTDTVRQSRGSKDQLGAFARGSLLSLPAGPLETIVGAEFARDAYDVSIPGQLEIHDGRRAAAAYGELRVPLLRAGASGAEGWSLATLTLAGRRDRYSDFGSANTYQAGLEMRPARGLLLRASTATSFKPPTLLQTNVDDASYPAELFELTDPARGGEAIVSGEVLRTTNTNLEPERGRAFALGAVWEPADRSGLRLAATHWRVKIDGLIAILPAQTALDQEAQFPGFVTRGPASGGQPGPVTRILLTEVNFGRVDTAGTDLEAAFGWRNSLGRWTTSAGATRTSKYRVALAPGQAEDDRLGRRYENFWAPRWKARLGLGFDRGPWNLGLTGRYLGAYKDSGSNGRRLGDQWLYDLAAGIDLKALGLLSGPGVSAASLSLAVVNVTDRQPQFVASSPYYDVTQADWRGRYAGLRLSVDW